MGGPILCIEVSLLKQRSRFPLLNFTLENEGKLETHITCLGVPINKHIEGDLFPSKTLIEKILLSWDPIDLKIIYERGLSFYIMTFGPTLKLDMNFKKLTEVGSFKFPCSSIKEFDCKTKLFLCLRRCPGFQVGLFVNVVYISLISAGPVSFLIPFPCAFTVFGRLGTLGAFQALKRAFEVLGGCRRQMVSFAS